MQLIVKAALSYLFLAASCSAQSITVQTGDTLSRIAQRELGDASLWVDLCNLNSEQLPDCDKLKVGSSLQLSEALPTKMATPEQPMLDEVPLRAPSVEPDDNEEVPELQTLAIRCDQMDPLPAFERTYEIKIQTGRLSFLRGSLGVEGYERWDGSIDQSGHVNIDGQYLEGSPDLKEIKFAGQVSNTGSIKGEGNRGPRSCSFSSTP